MHEVDAGSTYVRVLFLCTMRAFGLIDSLVQAQCQRLLYTFTYCIGRVRSIFGDESAVRCVLLELRVNSPEAMYMRTRECLRVISEYLFLGCNCFSSENVIPNTIQNLKRRRYAIKEIGSSHDFGLCRCRLPKEYHDFVCNTMLWCVEHAELVAEGCD